MPDGGALFDLGVYNVTTLTGLLGPAKRVMAMSGVDIPERVVDGAMTEVRVHDNAQILLDFGAGVYAAITTGFTIQEYRCPGIKLYGTAGTIQMIGEDWAPRGYELWQNSDGCWQVYVDRGIWPWTDGLRDLIEAIHEDRPPHVQRRACLSRSRNHDRRDGCFIPAGSPHRYYNMGDRPVDLLFGVAPHFLAPPK